MKSTNFVDAYTANPPKERHEPNLGVVRYVSIRDYVFTLRAASCSSDHQFWWPDQSIQFSELVDALFHYAAPYQVFSIESSRPEPEWVPRGALGGGGQAADAFHDVQVVYHGTNPSAVPSIFADGFARGPGAGQEEMKGVFGVTVLG
eukprot:2591457-Alexandrium_andersonii.AAC.1